MSHCRLLFVGGRDALQKVYDTANDSSSETKAELTIGADWVSDYDWLNEEEKKRGRTTDNFTKENKELYQQILDNRWYACFDVRNPEKYGDFGWVNMPEQMEKSYRFGDAEERNHQKIIEAIKQLPNDTLFHFADSHW